MAQAAHTNSLPQRHHSVRQLPASVANAQRGDNNLVCVKIECVECVLYLDLAGWKLLVDVVCLCLLIWFLH